MKIQDELIPLAKEHHRSLSLANQAINTARSEVKSDVTKLCQEISGTFWDEFKEHFQTEETTIFAPLMEHDSSLIEPCEQLIKEHQALKALAESLPDKPEKLYDFGLLLRTHTRLEDRVVFKSVVDLDKKQQQKVLQTSLKHSSTH